MLSFQYYIAIILTFYFKKNRHFHVYFISLNQIVLSTITFTDLSLNGFSSISTIGYLYALSIVSFDESPVIIDTGIFSK